MTEHAKHPIPSNEQSKEDPLTSASLSKSSVGMIVREVRQIPPELLRKNDAAGVQQILGGENHIWGLIVGGGAIGESLKVSNASTRCNSLQTSSVTKIFELRDGSVLLETKSGSSYRLTFDTRSKPDADNHLFYWEGSFDVSPSNLQNFRTQLLTERAVETMRALVKVTVMLQQPETERTPTQTDLLESLQTDINRQLLRYMDYAEEHLTPADKGELLRKLAVTQVRISLEGDPGSAVLNIPFREGIFEHVPGSPVPYQIVARTGDRSHYVGWRPMLSQEGGFFFKLGFFEPSELLQATKDKLERAVSCSLKV